MPYSNSECLAVVASSDSGNLAWQSVYQDRFAVFWLDAKKQAVRRLSAGTFTIPHHDCNQCLVSILEYDHWANEEYTKVYDLRTGSFLNSVPGRAYRVGSLLVRWDEEGSTQSYFDSRTGKRVWQGNMYDDRNKAFPPPVGTPVWITPTRGIFLIDRSDKSNPSAKDIVDVDVGTWKQAKKSWLSDFSMAFDKLVGNPEVGTFAIYEKTNRSTQVTGIFRRDLQRLPLDLLSVSDIGPKGVLGLAGENNESGYPQYKGIVCADASTGRIRWVSPLKAPARWAGEYAVTGTKVLNAGSGAIIGQFEYPKGRKVFLESGDLVFCVTQNEKPRIEAYRLISRRPE